MGNFRQNSRGGFRGRSSGGFGSKPRGFRDRGNFGGDRSSERRTNEMYDAVCSKCHKKCQVPFKPTGSKPVYCSDCFKKVEGQRSRDNESNSEASSMQLNQMNAKLDRILAVLENLELDTGDDIEEGIDDESEEDESDDEDLQEEDEEEEESVEEDK
ncbi:MAG: hypothetical protein Q7S27_05775 [Nanoarchaeota archaeon]|nr:hypothetical protein [Nanoarchaeota archaeon]